MTSNAPKRTPKVEAEIDVGGARQIRTKPPLAIGVSTENDRSVLTLDVLDEFGGVPQRFVTLRLSWAEARRLGAELLRASDATCDAAKAPHLSFTRMPCERFPLGASVLFPTDHEHPIGNTSVLVPAGTYAHVVASDEDMITVVPHRFIEGVSDGSTDWIHEIQWNLEDLQALGRMPFEVAP
jgi:hypothetical protein